MPKKTRVGNVISNKMQNTLVVAVTSFKAHPLYHKPYRVTKKIHAHTTGQYQIGDKVTVEETRQISKTKSWRVVE